MNSPSIQLFAFNNSIARELREKITAMATAYVPLVNPSQYQSKIFEWIEKGRGSAIVRAVAGSGKTTTCLHALVRIPDVDLSRVRASTFHAVGYGAILKKLGLKADAVKPDGGKVKRLLREGLGDVDYEAYGDFVSHLVGLAKGAGVGPLEPDVESAWYDLIQHHDLYLDAEGADEAYAIALARGFLKVSNEVALAGAIDFDDMLYLPLIWECRLWQNDWVICDEAQDTNAVRRAIARLALRPGGRLLAVGDERQAIYGFTGASHDAMDLIKSAFDCVELPLTISYRCPASVGERVRELVPYFETLPSAKKGRVEDLSLDDALKLLTPSDVILCRNTAPLVSLAFRLIARGIGCTVLGKEIGAGLVTLVKKRNARGVDQLLENLAAYREREVAKFTGRGEEGKAEAVSDRVACVETVVENLSEKERTVPALIAKLESLFSDANGVLTLCTAHKAKGREWRRVAILRPDLMPSKWARQDWQALQETNLQYVAWSRTLDELYFLTDEGR
jgi:superfamily I DNA/RNA helicase